MFCFRRCDAMVFHRHRGSGLVFSGDWRWLSPIGSWLCPVYVMTISHCFIMFIDDEVVVVRVRRLLQSFVLRHTMPCGLNDDFVVDEGNRIGRVTVCLSC